MICGIPVYDYDHMFDWAKHHRHLASEITLLCSQHHRDRTSGMLPLEQVRKADADPHNKREGISPWHRLHYGGQSCKIALGTVETTGEDGSEVIGLLINDLPIVKFSFIENEYALDVCIPDDRGNVLLSVVRNELMYSATGWDIEWVGHVLTFRDASRVIRLSIRFDPPNKVTVTRGSVAYEGHEVWISKEGVFLPASATLVAQSSARGMHVLLGLGENYTARSVAFSMDDAGYGSFNRTEMQAEMKSRFIDLKAQPHFKSGEPRMEWVRTKRFNSFGMPLSD